MVKKKWEKEELSSVQEINEGQTLFAGHIMTCPQGIEVEGRESVVWVRKAIMDIIYKKVKKAKAN